MNNNDLLIELLTEELPPKILSKLAQAFHQKIQEALQKAQLPFTKIEGFATPRRLAVLVHDLAKQQPDQQIERRGPAWSAAFAADGQASPACVGFARSCGVTPDALIKISTPQGEWAGFKQTVAGKSLTELLPAIVEQAALALPVAKRMRWGAGDTQFVRPIHAVTLLYGDQVIEAALLGCRTDRTTLGHRFLAPGAINIPRASEYVELLEKNFVMVDFNKRRQLIREQAKTCANGILHGKGQVLISSDALLDEVTGLVEWPTAYCGQFDAAFLNLPKEVLISAMQDHQRYFPVVGDGVGGALLPYFVFISNIVINPPPQPSPARGEGARTSQSSPARGEGVRTSQSSPARGEGAGTSQSSPTRGEGARTSQSSPARTKGAQSSSAREEEATSQPSATNRTLPLLQGRTGTSQLPPPLRGRVGVGGEGIIHGNERVLRARLADAAFFYDSDKKESLEKRVDHLTHIVFQAKLGTLYDKTQRLIKLATFINNQMTSTSAQAQHIARAALLAKTDLTTQMVNEFPELQGIMGDYYAQHDGEAAEVATALQEHYLPRFAGDRLPTEPVGQVLALADRIDTLVSAFGIQQLPTGDKDPYGLRRAALGIIRILIEKKINLDLQMITTFAVSCFDKPLENQETATQVLAFIQERLRSWSQEQGIPADVFAAVAALNINDPLDAYRRMLAVQTFKKLNEAASLSTANKRVSNILTKYQQPIQAKMIDPGFFEHDVEKILTQQLEEKSAAVARLAQSGKYEDVLLQLASLHQPIDDFFERVLVMADDQAIRENRLLILNKLRKLFLQVADIALLQ
jgi:glycyl-tRNA synthetase beta subunit